jgi:hypothetical protein
MKFTPGRHNEAYIQFELYRLLVNNGFQVYPEYKCSTGQGNKHCRFDLVLHSEGEIYLIIEIKRSIKSQQEYIGTKQYTKYSAFGIPLVYVNRSHDLSRVVEVLSNKYSSKLNAICVNVRVD